MLLEVYKKDNITKENISRFLIAVGKKQRDNKIVKRVYLSNYEKNADKILYAKIYKIIFKLFNKVC